MCGEKGLESARDPHRRQMRESRAKGTIGEETGRNSGMRKILLGVLLLASSGVFAQSPGQSANVPASTFDVATIKPVPPDAKAGRYITMQGTNRFVAKDYTLKLLIAAAYSLSPKTISGGPAWVDTDHYDILALTPGDTRPTQPEQMAMLRALLTDRFKLNFHRQEREFSIYVLEVAKGGSKLKESTAQASDPTQLISTVYPDHMHLPAKNATMGDFAALLQRALLNRPVVDKTGLTGRYDFDLDWAQDETQFGGQVPVASADAEEPPFFTAIEQQLGLRIEATRGVVPAFVIDGVERPTAD
jgi:uncharacterized protein (TIGR03435 family)